MLACAARPTAYLPDPPLSEAAAQLAPAAPLVRATVSQVLAPGELSVLAIVLEVDAPAETSLREAHLTAGSTPACQSGRAVGVISVDDQRQWSRPIPVTGRHRVTLELPLVAEGNDQVGMQTEDVADLSFNVDGRGATPATGGGGAAEALCLRVPLPSGAHLRKRNAWSWGGSVRMDPPLLLAYSAVARVGRWVGPLRLGAELGGSIRQCENCGSNMYAGLPAALTAEILPTIPSGAGLGLEGAYMVRPVVGLGDGDTQLLHGPRLTLRFAVATQRRGIRPGGPRAHYAAFDLWFARWTAVGVPHWSQTLFGLGWTWDDGI